VSRLNIQEKAKMVSTHPQLCSVPRLGTPTIIYGEAQHGLIKGCIFANGTACSKLGPDCKCPTSFPSLVGVGASFNKSLFTSMGKVMADEARAYYNVLGGNTNIVFWAPNINLAKNVLW
jgi:beta-glucosidase-like glycosyl hydrolase